MAEGGHKRSLYPTETVCEAIRVSAGVITSAAAKLGIHRKTLHDWINAEPALQEARDEAREVMLDLAEAGLIDLLREKDRESIKFYLRCFGKKRGYVETFRHEGPGGGPIPVAAVQMTTDEFRAIAREIAEDY